MAYNSTQYKINSLQSQYTQKLQQIDNLQTQIDNNTNAINLIGTPGYMDSELVSYQTQLTNKNTGLVTEQKKAFVMLKAIQQNLQSLGVSNVG